MRKSKETDAASSNDWAPPAVRKEDGVQLQGASALPANHRLRAEALVAAGKEKDPDGIIGEELIADTKERLAAEAADAPATPAGDDKPEGEGEQ